MRHWFDEDFQDYQELLYEDEEDEPDAQYFDVDMVLRLTTRRDYDTLRKN